MGPTHWGGGNKPTVLYHPSGKEVPLYARWGAWMKGGEPWWSRVRDQKGAGIKSTCWSTKAVEGAGIQETTRQTQKKEG